MTAFAELCATTNFSFLRGASHPEEMAQTAKALGLAGLGVGDRTTLAGVVRAHAGAKREGLRFAPGARLVFTDDAPDAFVYPRDRAAYGRLCRLLTIGNRRAPKGECWLTRADFLAHANGLQTIVAPEAADAEACAFLRDVIAASGAAWLAIPALYDGRDARRRRALLALAAETGARPLATTLPLMHAPERGPLLDVLTCIRGKTTLDAAGRRLHANCERHLKAPAEVARLFQSCPETVSETVRFMDQLAFSLDDLRYEYPEETKFGFATAQDALEAFTWEGAATRYPGGVPEKVRATLERELAIVAQLNYAPYFLTVHDIVRFARSDRDKDGGFKLPILCQGRGSAANSAICYCLGVTEVDPAVNDLLFDRFVSTERNEPPDIDVDFEHERREEVLQYVYATYGRHRAGLAATLVCYRGRSAIRETAKAFGYSEDRIGALAKLFHWWTESVTDNDVREKGFDPSDARLRACMALARELHGFPRHLSQHVGGFVITRERLDDVIPIQNAAMEDRTVVEWNKDDLEELGILKVDLLGLGMLTCIRKAFDLIGAHYPDWAAYAAHDQPETYAADLYSEEEKAQMASSLPRNGGGVVFPGGVAQPPTPPPQAGEGCALSLCALPKEDPRVYAMLQRADSLGVFQVESRAQMSMLPRLRPERFYDLVIEVAIVRPGPIQGGMVHPYLKRKQGLEKVSYPSKELEAVLRRTLGVPLFQEQAMQIAIVGAGFSPPEADKLRRAMATFRRVGTIGLLKEKFINGMIANGYAPDFAEASFRQIEGFGEYGFPESHAASFALLVYASSWLKCHYPDVFAAALMNSQPMGFYAPAQIVRDAREHGVEIRAVDVNHSDWDCTLEPGQVAAGHIQARHGEMAGDVRSTRAIRLGFREVKGLREDDMRALMAARDGAARRDGSFLRGEVGGGAPSSRGKEALAGSLPQPSLRDDSSSIEGEQGAAFDSVRDLWLRTGLSPAVIERLAGADAFASLGLSRREALWAARGLMRVGGQDDLPLFARAHDPTREPDYHLPRMPLGEEIVEDYRALSLSLKAHPAGLLRAALAEKGAIPCERLAQLRDGAWVKVAGLVLVRQRPGTAKGVIFMTLEDETHIANIIVWPNVFERFRAETLGARLAIVEGRVQSQSGVIHVVAERVRDETRLLSLLARGGEGLEPPAKIDEARRGPEGDARVKRDLFKRAETAMPGGRNFH
jgi:error-prone DNA polymerase